jgi:hypothetical protein
MVRSLSFAAFILVLTVLALSPEGAGASSVPGSTEVRFLLTGYGDSLADESAAMLIMGGVLMAVAWMARRPSSTH